MSYAADLASIRAAHERIRAHVHRTPVMTSATLDRRAGARLFFKCENLQKGGAFKARGASHAIRRLDEPTAARGVVTHSSGNHAQAVALAARARGIPAHIVMPTDAPRVKRAAVEGYGATVHPCEPTLEARTTTAARVVAETGGTLVPPYDHPDVIAGQGTTALELLAQVPDLDAVVVPVGGGGLLAGMTLALRELAPDVRVFAAEPSGADDAFRSKRDGRRVDRHTPKTICDGLKTTLGELTWPVVRDLVEAVIPVEDLLTLPAMKLVFERMKLVIEPSAAVGLAAVLSSRFRRLEGLERVGVVFTGGNVDLDALPWTRPRRP
ncbi:MAG TPA: pyridoxal-phosphate dependent enzyme [Sandaracinaceae bacterium LLY-WYZ-13_1]|nr:pyridoxal-phosphate dependent enzyme [Sandaracinaceae bacterium LLY-WYZ-13_1]